MVVMDLFCYDIIGGKVGTRHALHALNAEIHKNIVFMYSSYMKACI